MGVGGQRHAPGRFIPGKEIRYPLYRRLGGPRCRSGWERKIFSLPGSIHGSSRYPRPVFLNLCETV